MTLFTSPLVFTKRTALLVVGIAVFAVGFAGAFNDWVPIPRVSISWPLRDANEYQPRGVSQIGREVALVFIGSSSCSWSNVDYLPGLIEGAKVALARRADSLEYSFSATGLVQSTSTNAGAIFLQKFGQFDEVAFGRGWYNIGLQKYVYETFPGPPATPQIVVVERWLGAPPSRQITRERVLVRRIGAEAIEAWVVAGAPLPIGEPGDH
jgi:hypothetical protein